MTQPENVKGFNFSMRDGHLVLRVTTDKRARMLELVFDEADTGMIMLLGVLQ